MVSSKSPSSLLFRTPDFILPKKRVYKTLFCLDWSKFNKVVFSFPLFVCIILEPLTSATASEPCRPTVAMPHDDSVCGAEGTLQARELTRPHAPENLTRTDLSTWLYRAGWLLRPSPSVQARTTLRGCSLFVAPLTWSLAPSQAPGSHE